MNSFVLAFPDTIDVESVHVTWHIDGVDYARDIDAEMSDDTGKYYTSPVVTSLRDSIAVTIDGLPDGTIPELVATDTVTYHSVYSIREDSLLASVVPHIVSRSEWGADESLRYRSIAYVDAKISEWESR